MNKETAEEKSKGAMRMLYITGDVHADLKEFNERKFVHIKKTDSIIICGDFGILWKGDRIEQRNIKAIGRKHHFTLFLDGTHENFDLLEEYPITEWNGGKVQVLSGNLMHLMRGQVYEIGGKKIFVFGGGESIDKEFRTERESWWPQEMPNAQEMQEGLRNLEGCGWKVDYIFTHSVPTTFRKLMEPEVTHINPLNAYLDEIREKCAYEKWIFGSYHRDKRYSQSCECIFRGVIQLG